MAVEMKEYYDSEDGSSVTSSEYSVDPDAELTPRQRCFRKTNAIIDGKYVTTAMTIATVYALFGDDVRLWALPASADDATLVLSTIAFFLFMIELGVNMVVKTKRGEPVNDDSSFIHVFTGISGYLFSFFFWLDLVAALSMLPEVTWIWAALTGEGDEPDGGATDLGAARAGRTSRVGSKAGRVIRMVRLVRLLKLYTAVRAAKTAQKAERERAEKEGRSLPAGGRKLDRDVPMVTKQSNVGARLSEITTRRVIIVVLLMLICVPVFQFTVVDLSEEVAFDDVHFFNTHRELAGWDESLTIVANGMAEQPDAEGVRWLVRLKLLPAAGVPGDGDGLVVDYPETYNLLRTGLQGEELVKLSREEEVGGTTYTTELWFSHKPQVEETAYLGFGLTWFIIVLLVAGSYFFSSDAQRLVLRPIEHMVEFVKLMADDPLTEISSRDNTGQYETQLLENTIKKIGGLLRVGFGSAGASIIAKNLKSEEAGSKLNPMVPGQKMYGVFGFIYVTQFNFATGVLGEQVLLFINKISKIVHDVTIEWGGAPNKNLGEGYLLAWRLDTSSLERPKRRGSASSLDRVKLRDSPRGSPKAASFSGSPGGGDLAGSTESVGGAGKAGAGESRRSRAPADVDLTLLGVEGAKVADRALCAVIKCVGEVSRSKDLQDSDEMEKLLAEKDDYRVGMLYGLHAGWAIEGAIGSIFKVDASYLSPHVNIAARMMAASRQYGKNLLCSESFVALLSDCPKKYIRKLDRVAVKGSKVPLAVYTNDMWEFAAKEESQLMPFEMFIRHCEDPDVYNRNQSNIPAHKRRISILGAKRIIEHPVEEQPWREDLFDTDAELKSLRMPFSDEFRRKHQRGVALYLKGDWGAARTVLEGTLVDEMLPDRGGDGPSKTILSYMKDFGYVAPSNWQGYRALTEK